MINSLNLYYLDFFSLSFWANNTSELSYKVKGFLKKKSSPLFAEPLESNEGGPVTFPKKESSTVVSEDEELQTTGQRSFSNDKGYGLVSKEVTPELLEEWGKALARIGAPPHYVEYLYNERIDFLIMVLVKSIERPVHL